MKIKKKNMYWKQTGTAILCIALLWTQTVYAGTINAAEQTVINFYERTFYYKGKNYAATEAAKAGVYEKLMSDDVDLTEVQAKSAIRQASKNIAQGILEGVLVEVASEEIQEPGEEDQKDDGGTEGGKEPETEEKVGDGEKPAADGSKEDGEDIGTGGDEGNDSKESKDSNSSQNQEKKKEEHVPKPYKKIDIEQLLEKALQENSNARVETGNRAETVTVEQYSAGKLTAVSRDGYLLFSGELPIKNTGYRTGNLKFAVGMLLAVLAGSILAAAGWIIAARKRRKEYRIVKYEKK